MTQIRHLIQFVVDPNIIKTFTLAEWDAFVDAAKTSQCLARCAFQLKRHDLMEGIPKEVRWHFDSAIKQFEAHERTAHREIKALQKALKPFAIEPVILKGAAYLVQEELSGSGRYFNDIDLLVESSQLNQAEGALRLSGWVMEDKDQHDERYYRQWMHEIPPMSNPRSGVTVDLHHSIYPPLGKFKFSTDALMKDLSYHNGSYTLLVHDRFVHCAVHLLYGDSTEQGMRDLWDMYLLLEQYYLSEDDLANLWQRAEKFDAGYVVSDVIYLLFLVFPSSVTSFASKCLQSRVQSSFRRFLRWRLYYYGFLGGSQLKFGFSQKLASGLLLARNYWFRLPLRLLVVHLVWKALLKPLLQLKVSRSEK